ncbi:MULTISPECIES: amylo-alpha-1,6-glucosidase [Sphingobium]|uniref:amylo-alpha-1,6-glucosidase n=1 Tax=Sphingobium TaxID=165695 RepID=UPI001BE67347|nr:MULTISPECIES: amylo-alpha-1,6-glucosidase [Sphingobium]MBT2246327.1 amylo-alpha-1,6-glucosidase [Sphingobium sp. BHU LFT2]WBQ19269.1 amylo-alpha-1,6-glucosidase [Sphingobium yanoikuyae]
MSMTQHESDLPGIAGGQALSQAQTQFFIPATASLHERRPRTLKHGDSFAVFDHSGDAISGPGSPEGLYHRDTRHLSHLYLTVNNMRPILLSSALRDDNAMLTCDLANPDFPGDDGRVEVEHDLIHLRRTRFLWKGAIYERITIRNFDTQSRKMSVELAFGADFADLFEIRGMTRLRRGTLRPPKVGAAEVLLSYVGRDYLERATHLHFDPPPLKLTESSARFEVNVAPGERCTLFARICCGHMREEEPLPKQFLKCLREAMRELRHARSRGATIRSSNDLFNEVARRSVADISMLSTETEHGPYPYAGIPWFSTVFGRDALITAIQTLWLDPAVSRGVLGYLAAHQAISFDPASDAEPGKILHEVRHGEMAELGEVPFRHYYGSIDSTPLFVMLAGAYLERTGDIAFLRTILSQIEAALAWIDVHGDRDGDGFVEYGRLTDQGLQNQGWKDSHDSIFHADGSIAKGPIALVEVQAYVYGAWNAAAAIYLATEEADKASTYRARAADLRDRFDAAFFDAALGTYVLALDGEKRPCRVRSSNAGHVLYTGLAKEERAATVVHTLMAPSSFSGWGVRTIASTEKRYNPMSYHNGSIWPHDNALIAAGFSRYGFQRQAAQIFEGLFAAATYVDMMRLPELFCGFPRRRSQGPTFYPVACSPQAWSAAAPLALIQSSLGLRFDVPSRQIIFSEPAMPTFLNALNIRALSVGSGKADISFERMGETVIVKPLDRSGDVSIVTLA